MDNAGYVLLARQSGLTRALDVLANNVANMSTTGFQREAVIFNSIVQAGGNDVSPVSTTDVAGRYVDAEQGSLVKTGRDLDFAVQGDGYFRVQTPGGERLTRNGAFQLGPEGQLVTGEGYPVLDEAGAPLQLPPSSEAIYVAPDGSLSVGGEPVGRLGLVAAAPESVTRESGVLFAATGTELATGRIAQGFIEESNVNPVEEITRLIEVQRAFEIGQSMLADEDERIRSTVEQLGRTA